MAKYRDIADDIRQKIKNQEYTFGQNSLMSMYCV